MIALAREEGDDRPTSSGKKNMASPSLTRSISLPIILASITLALSIFLLVGWTLVIIQNLSLTREVTPNSWLPIAGIISLVIIMSVLVMFSVFLVREILEVRRQNNFIDSVTHELKSPLASLKLCLQTLARPELNSPQREELRQMMLSDVDRLSVFIDDVLEASRIAHGRVGHELADVSLRELVESCAKSVARRYKAPDASILLSVPDEIHLFTDKTALEIVVKNLLDNAFKYSDTPPHVEIKAQKDSDMMILEVRDQGIGIPKQHLKRIFERFYRVPGEAVHARRGTGLGLYVVSALVRNLGGNLRASSEGPGMGTAVEIALPLLTEGHL